MSQPRGMSIGASRSVRTIADQRLRRDRSNRLLWDSTHRNLPSMAQGLIPRANSSFPDEFDRSSPPFRLEGQTGDSVLSGAGFRTFSQEAALEPRRRPHRYWES